MEGKKKGYRKSVDKTSER
jgi:hypothetical protein